MGRDDSPRPAPGARAAGAATPLGGRCGWRTSGAPRRRGPAAGPALGSWPLRGEGRAFMANGGRLPHSTAIPCTFFKRGAPKVVSKRGATQRAACARGRCVATARVSSSPTFTAPGVTSATALPMAHAIGRSRACTARPSLPGARPAVGAPPLARAATTASSRSSRARSEVSSRRGRWPRPASSSLPWTRAVLPLGAAIDCDP
jgi:hypothetical protein